MDEQSKQIYDNEFSPENAEFSPEDPLTRLTFARINCASTARDLLETALFVNSHADRYNARATLSQVLDTLNKIDALIVSIDKTPVPSPDLEPPIQTEDESARDIAKKLITATLELRNHPTTS